MPTVQGIREQKNVICYIQECWVSWKKSLQPYKGEGYNRFNAESLTPTQDIFCEGKPVSLEYGRKNLSI